MRNKYLIYVIILICNFQVNAQNSVYYYYKKQKVFLTLEKSSVSLSMSNQFEKNHISNLSLKQYDVSFDRSISTQLQTKFANIEFTNTPTDISYFEYLNYLKSVSTVETVNPNFITSDGQKIGMSNYFYVKLKDNSNFAFMQSLATSKNVLIVKQDTTLPLWYILKCSKNTIENTLEIANLFFETGNFDSASPDFLSYENNDYLISNSTATLNSTSNNYGFTLMSKTTITLLGKTL